MGIRARRACTVMGDAVAVASRLAGRTKYHGVGTLAGQVLWQETLRAWRAHRREQVEADLQQLQCMDANCEITLRYAGCAAEVRSNPPPYAGDGVAAFDEK